MGFLDGWKTVIVAVASLMYGIGGFVAGFHSWDFAIPIIQTALVALGLRAAIESLKGAK